MAEPLQRLAHHYTTHRVGDHNYLVDPTPITLSRRLLIMIQWPPIVPVTVLCMKGQKEVNSQVIKDKLFEYRQYDDVICKEFTVNAIALLDKESEHCEFSGQNHCAFVRGPSDEDLRGPYFMMDGNLHRVYKLFPDPNGAFVCGIVKDLSQSGDSHQQIDVGLGIPVPSKLYFSPPTCEPLSGLVGKRIVVKDIYDIRGVKTGAGSKSYLYLQEKSAYKTADAIQTLIDKGAIIIGKTKTTQMASGAAPRDWIDYQCPFNPRGCGYLDPDCSSSGSAVAIAAYRWVDCAIGSDSLGSMVGPAAANGVFGIRPTHGILSNERAIAVSRTLDTPGHFCRSWENLSLFAKNWFPKSTQTSPPDVTRILVFKEPFADFPDPDKTIFQSFIDKMEETLTIRHEDLDIDALWKDTQPDVTQKLDEYLATTLATIQLYGSYHNNLRFRSEYKARFDKEPAIDEMVRYKWHLGSKITEDEYNKALAEQQVFKNFINQHVLKEGTVLLLPGGMPSLIYRDAYSGNLEESAAPWQGYGFRTTTFSSLAGVPCLSFPIAQTPYQSKNTGREEWRPVSMWMLGATGTDESLMVLLKIIFQGASIRLDLYEGHSAFGGTPKGR